MTEHLKVTLIGEDPNALDRLDNILAPVNELKICRLSVVGTVDIAALKQQHPDVVIVRLGDNPEQLLEQMIHPVLAMEAEMIVTGPENDMALMRRAMQCGARDYLPHPVCDEELLRSLEAIFESRRAARSVGQGRVTAVVSASGGTGGTFLACNLAHIMADQAQRSTLLLDLDLQFGSAMQYLDISNEYGLEDVLAQLDSLDQTALDGYLASHNSGLKVLAAHHSNLLARPQISSAQLLKLMGLLRTSVDELVVDLPVHLMSSCSVVLEQADRICLVVQQEVMVVRNALRWLDQCEAELGISRDRFLVVVNRYSKKLDISLDDIRKTLKVSDLAVVPGDYKKVSSSVNAGLPLLAQAPKSEVTQALVALHTRFSPQVKKQDNTLQALASRLFRR